MTYGNIECLKSEQMSGERAVTETFLHANHRVCLLTLNLMVK
jgi:hypothetical protein